MENLTYEDWEEYIEGEDFETVSPEEPTSQSRWSTYYTQVVKQKSTGKFFRLEWESGSTEYQDMPWEDMYHEVTEVFPREVIKTIYIKKDT